MPCRFPPAEVEWLQRALGGWEQVSRDFLKVDPEPLPWIVMFDASCVWHLALPESDPGAGPRPVETTLPFAGRSIRIRALTHKGTINLPNGGPIAAETKASTAVYRNGRAAFFVMAMPSLWQTRDMSAATRAEYLQGVFTHEMTHTRLLVAINRRVRELARKNDLVYPINDDVIQTQFREAHGFEAAFNRERDQFYRAALEPDVGKRRELTLRALEMARMRRARYFTGPTEAYAELESLFLTLEGVGQWAAYRLVKARTAGNEAEALKLVRDNRRYWSQDEGLALFLLIDALVPDWQARVFTANPAPPLDLLEESVGARR
jgi:hypothetical protein